MFVTVPSDLQQNYYTRAFEWNGLYVLSGPAVQLLSLETAAETAFNMLRYRPDLVALLVEGNSRVAVTPQGASIVVLPEFRYLNGQYTFDGRPWNKVTGIAGYEGGGYIVANTETNILSLPNDPYRGDENITLHEWAHAIHMGAIEKVASLNNELKAAYNSAKAAGLWGGTYAGANVYEYFAVATEAFFDFTREPDSSFNHVNTRAELKQYDPKLFVFMVKIYGNDTWRDGDWIGSAGADVLNGLSTSDLIFGLGGNDIISAGGGSDKLYGGTGNDTLTGGAGDDFLCGDAGADNMRGGAGNDTYIVDYATDIVNEGLAGSNGIDTVRSSVGFSLANGPRTMGAVEYLSLQGAAAINGTGNSLANAINGNIAANVLNGGSGNDVLNGGGGNDTLYGGTGNDRLAGGAGSDYFVFNTALNPVTNVDRITDFNVAADTIRLDNAVMPGLGATLGALAPGKFWKSAAGLAHDADDRIIYETDTGKLFYDSNGNTAGGAVVFAVLAANLALTNADFWVV